MGVGVGGFSLFVFDDLRRHEPRFECVDISSKWGDYNLSKKYHKGDVPVLGRFQHPKDIGRNLYPARGSIFN